MRLEMQSRWCWVSSLLVSVSCLVGNVVSVGSSSKRSAVTTQDVMDWLHNKDEIGGFVSDKIVVYDSLSNQGVGGAGGREEGGRGIALVASTDIKNDEVLLTIPIGAVLWNKNPKRGRDESCGTVVALDKEYYDLEEDSAYFPYTSFLMETMLESDEGENNKTHEHLHLPIHWSPEGKQLVRRLLGGELEPASFGMIGSFVEACVTNRARFEDHFTDKEQHLLEKSMFWVHSRGWNARLIPVVDWIRQNRTLANTRVEKTTKHGIATTTSEDVDDDDELSTDYYTLVATRNISKGENLYRSSSLTTPQMFELYGIVESYPQRWSFMTGYDDLEDPVTVMHRGDKMVETDDTFSPARVAFDLEREDEDGRGKLKLTWLSENKQKPSLGQMNWLVAHRRRLHALEGDVTTKAAALSNPQEAEMTLRYYRAIRNALDQAVIWARQHDGESALVEDDLHCVAPPASAPLSCPSRSTSDGDRVPQRKYDDLSSRPDQTNYNKAWLSPSCGIERFNAEYRETVESAYQNMKWSHFPATHYLDEASDDSYETCLHLDLVMHSCSSFFPHVHETIIHYPASYVDKVERVLYVGGGDLIMLHEILKYPSLELVIGMELDQAVVRSSFRHYGLQPHFDHDKVHWWFGDASKSLTLLPPEEYFGTFDLVVIDLLSFIFDTLFVGDELLVDYMMKFVKPNGVLVRQEDFLERHVVDFAKYTVEFEVHDLPYSCLQSFTMGSNGIDFSKKTPIEHPVDTIYYELFLKNRTSIWSNFNVNHNSKNRTRKDGSSAVQTKSAESPRYGVLAIVEAEETSFPLNEQSMVRTNLSRALKEVGLTVITDMEYPSRMGTYHSFVFVFNEGYLVARCWPEHNYCGFDLQLWNTIQNQEQAVYNLVAAVGGSMEHSTSSFVVLTGGMYGPDVANVHNIESSRHSRSNDAAARMDASSDGDIQHATPVAKIDLFKVLYEAMALIRQPDPTLIVLCGDQSQSCEALEFLESESVPYHLIPLWSCPPAVLSNSNETGRSGFLHCELSTKDNIGMSAAGKKIDGILIDPTTTKEMGKIIHKIFNNTGLRYQLLADDFTVLAPSTLATEEAWTNALFERFRTEIVYFNPVFHTHVLFTSYTSELGLRVLSAGDSDFYEHLMNVFKRVKEKTRLDHEMQLSKVGVMSHVPDYFSALVVTEESYDLKDSYKQWHTQNPIAHQTIIQYEVQKPLQAIPIGGKVLINDFAHPWEGRWYTGHVLNVSESGKYHVGFDGLNEETHMSRDRLLGIDPRLKESPLEFGDLILLRSSDDDNKEAWYQGSVVDVQPNGKYKLQMFDGQGEVLVAERSDVILRRETLNDVPADSPSFSSNVLISIITDVLNTLTSTTVHSADIVTTQVGDGYVIVGAFSNGGIVASWDGRLHLDINVFHVNASSKSLAETLQNSIKGKIPGLSRVQFDTHPRGFGRVVSDKHELSSLWFGQFHPFTSND
ncbi:hypothetical protein ACA910_003825 [Epithemia clementina (nom. ined.)]